MSLILADARWAGFYLLSVPDCVANDLDKYRSDFYAWLNDGDAGHGYREQISDGRSRKVYTYDGHEDLSGAAAFVGWLNDFVLKDSDGKAAILPRVELYPSDE